jgi:hypothetical protein
MRVTRMTTRGLMLVVALIAVSIALVFNAIQSSARMKQEIWARQGVVAVIDNSVQGAEMWIGNLERRIDRSLQQPIRDVRHDRWTRDLASRKKQRALYAKIKPTYERIVWRPWERFPTDEYFMVFYVDQLHERGAYAYDRAFEKAYRQWALYWALGISAAVLAVGSVVVWIAKRVIARRRPLGEVQTPVVTAYPAWLRSVRPTTAFTINQA